MTRTEFLALDANAQWQAAMDLWKDREKIIIPNTLGDANHVPGAGIRLRHAFFWNDVAIYDDGKEVTIAKDGMPQRVVRLGDA